MAEVLHSRHTKQKSSNNCTTCSSFLLTHRHLLLYFLSTFAIVISGMLIHSRDSIRALGAAEALSFSFPLQSLSLDPPLSIFFFLLLKGFCERPEIKGCPQWECDCRDSTGGPRCYQNCSLMSHSNLQSRSLPLSAVCTCATSERCSV